VRAGEAGLRDEAAGRIEAALKTIAALRSVHLNLKRVHALPESPCDAGFMDHLETAMSKLGLPTRRMVSGAGHDAMIFADMMPTAMLFIRCKGGISHNPEESVRVDDVEDALKVMLGFIDQLEATYI
jgi:allantoate deiminase